MEQFPSEVFHQIAKAFSRFAEMKMFFVSDQKWYIFDNAKNSGGKSEKNEFPRKLMSMQLVAIVYFSGNMWKSANLSFEHIRCGNEWCVLYVVYGCVRVHIGCSKHGYIIHVVMLLWPRSSRNMIELKSRWHNCALFQLYWFRSFDKWFAFNTNEFQLKISHLGKLMALKQFNSTKLTESLASFYCSDLYDKCHRNSVVEMLWFENGFHEMYIVAFIDMLSPLVSYATMILSLVNGMYYVKFQMHSR